MQKRSLKRKWLKTKIALSQTIHHILDINRHRKKLASAAINTEAAEQRLSEELKMLNKIADQQARLLERYEMALGYVPQPQSVAS